MQRCLPEAPMDLFEVVSTRRSIHAFLPDAPDAGDVRSILAAMNRAPSAGNLQSYRVVAVYEQYRREILARAAIGQIFLAEAPLVLCFFADPGRSASKYGERGEQLYALQDATLAASYAQLSATALGYGSVWVGSFDDEAVRRAVSAPEELDPVCMLAIGRVAEEPPPTTRRQIEEMVQLESFEGNEASET
jgi:nitroreductase